MKVAVVGGGISGLSAVWLLNEYSEHQVDLFEANNYIGGHTNTVSVKPTSAPACNVDTGFIVFNKLTYPNFLNFLKLLNVEYISSRMSFSVKRNFQPSYEWSGNQIKCLFEGITTWTDWISQYRLIWDLVRFNWLAVDVLKESEKTLTIDEYLIENNYSEAFKRNYLLPMISSIWSTPADKTLLLFPMRTLVRFMSNHHLLQILNQPEWLTIKNGSKTYVDKIMSKMDPLRVFKNTPIHSISINQSGQINLNVLPSQSYGPYDQVIFGAHADQIVKLLKKSDCCILLSEQIEILSKFHFNQNHAVLHNDLSLMPNHRDIWSAWNYCITPSEQIKPVKAHEIPCKLSHHSQVESTVSLTYCMNLLQSIPEKDYGLVLVTLNPPRPIDSKFVFGTWKYEHPLYTAESVEAQKQIAQIQTKNGLSFVGAWTNYGFHEDGLTSTLKLLTIEGAELFGVKAPIGVCIKDEPVQRAGWILRFFFTLIQFLIEVVLKFWVLFDTRLGFRKSSYKVQ
ncbi:hypothetical protein O181_024640 [Austropuccinia psidii MF-1]|uniref:Amine oxidase domain-containing protein n=1 Tax=Austropuccinia psidii MF-1 TaxID=1389203 RepID=A0A9Q3CKX5_9BASI|nr:hypothetical protein [Austropuccinia psidii MF-1]